MFASSHGLEVSVRVHGTLSRKAIQSQINILHASASRYDSSCLYLVPQLPAHIIKLILRLNDECFHLLHAYTAIEDELYMLLCVHVDVVRCDWFVVVDGCRSVIKSNKVEWTSSAKSEVSHRFANDEN